MILLKYIQTSRSKGKGKDEVKKNLKKKKTREAK